MKMLTISYVEIDDQGERHEARCSLSRETWDSLRDKDRGPLLERIAHDTIRMIDQAKEIAGLEE